jgi:F-type H+-transporting ATPase subunit gamma
VLGNISNGDGDLSRPYPLCGSRKALLILITSDRASCGAYNSTLIKLAKATMRGKYPEQTAKGNT